MNEYHFLIVCGAWDNGGGLILCMNSCIYARMYVYLCIGLRRLVCMHVCVYVWRITLSMSKRKQIELICCEEIPTFYRQARSLLRLQTLPRQLSHLPHTKLRHCRLIQSVLQLQRKNSVPPLEFGGAKFFFFCFLGAYPPLAPM